MVLFDKKRTILLVKSSVDKSSEIAYHRTDNRQKGIDDERLFLPFRRKACFALQNL